MKSTYAFLFFLSLLLLSVRASATHLRAGEITARRISCTTFEYEFTVKLYLRTAPGSATQDDIVLFFGDGSNTKVTTLPQIRLPNATEVGLNTFVVRHTFASAGNYTVYVGSCESENTCNRPISGLSNRNGGVLNMDDSLNTPFYIETQILVDFFVCNSSPVLLNPPIDKVCIGRRYTYDPAAFDPDGDSLSFRLVTPKQSINRDVRAYSDPNQTFGGTSENGGAAVFNINPVTGLVTWDAPLRAGEYNFAFVIEEWRRGVRLGFVRRDMQVVVQDCGNKRPEIIIPPDTCVTAGTLLKKTIRATDPDAGDNLLITSFGGVYKSQNPSFPNPAATFTFNPNPQKSPASGIFEWQTACQHVRRQPYQITFRVEDKAGESTPNPFQLTDSKSWRVTVVAPKPTNLKATPVAGTVRAIQLNWDPYSLQCGVSPNSLNLSTLQIIIYRKVGCDNRVPANCEVGVPASWGYAEIGRVPGNANAFVDDNKGKGLLKGVRYSYRIAVAFPEPEGGLSYASDEACIALSKDVPFLTNVSVEKTSKTAGQIFVRWTHPLEFNTASAPAPYSYRLLRAEGLNGTVFTEITRRNIAAFPTYPRQAGFVGDAADTTFTDINLNTDEKAYRYRVELYFTRNGTPTLRDSSSAASSVRLSPQGGPESVIVNWEYNVPWQNENQKHIIYRKINGTFVKIDSITATTSSRQSYTDDGRFNKQPLVRDSLYCYFVETQGKYNDFDLPTGLFKNKSQEACRNPLDTTKPCPPILAVKSVDCGLFRDNPERCSSETDPGAVKLENLISWRNLYPAGCDRDIVSYKLYYKAHEDDSLAVLVSLTDTFYTHFNLIKNQISLAGCYAVTAIDGSGNESRLSNIVCVDNCPYYSLPNVITPKVVDGKNDKLQPCPTKRFVDNVKFTVYNRWGKKVFARSNDVDINWDGNIGISEEDRGEVNNGIYYYEAEVQFIRLRRSDEKQFIKGWVQILK
jgi:hypothetical protein